MREGVKLNLNTFKGTFRLDFYNLSVSREGGLGGFLFMIIYGLWSGISLEKGVKAERFIFAFAIILIF